MSSAATAPIAMSAAAASVVAPRQLTHTDEPHVLTNVNVFSPDGQWIVYDVRSDGGANFDADRIERVNVHTGQVDLLYRATDGAKCGVVSYDPSHDRVAFILGPARPTPDFNYAASRRHGVIVDCTTRAVQTLDARDLVPPFTPGALRGGTHVHIFSPDGTMVSSTYEDDVLERLGPDGSTHDLNRRTIAVSVLNHPTVVADKGARDHDGCAFTFVAARTVNDPRPGSDEIARAFEESWVGRDGYVRPDRTRQHKALAFQGEVITPAGTHISEVFIVDLPEDPTRASSAGPLEGSATRRPQPPAGCTQRRLTFTADRAAPGIQGPRHWLRSSPDGTAIAFLMKDDAGVPQLWTISPNGGEPKQITHGSPAVQSSFTWNREGDALAFVMDNSVCMANTRSGEVTRLTPRASDDAAPRSIAAVFSPDGRSIAFVAPMKSDRGTFDQVCVVDVPANR